MANLPPSVLALVEFYPAEDLMLAVLREKLPDVKVVSEIKPGLPIPFVMVRRAEELGYWGGDERFIDSARINIDVFCEDPNGDEDAALLAEAVRVAVRNAKREQKVYPGLGHLVSAEMVSAPTRSPDWATASGPVQYADLPSNVWRYEVEFDVEIRKPRSNRSTS